jgi:hypothetical protein
MRLREIRRSRNGPTERRDCFGIAPLPLQRQALIVIRNGEIGLELDRPAETICSFDEIALGKIDQSEIVMGGRIVRLEFGRGFESGHGFLNPAVLAEQLCELNVCVGVLRL